MLARLLLVCLLSLPALSWAEPAFIYLVRHGEKAPGPDKDPPLTAQGQARARNIAATLRHAGIGAVFSSNTTRTQQTARPMAQAVGATVQSYDAAKPAELVAHLKALPGGAVLVVGHSDTLPDLVRLLGGTPGADIGDTEYDRLYQLSRGADGSIMTVRLSSLP
jgi:broad specificity phosphatase PhoE